MAFEAECRASTVLEALCVMRKARHPWVWLLAALATRPSATAPHRLGAPGGGCRLGTANSKFEIRNPYSSPSFNRLRSRRSLFFGAPAPRARLGGVDSRCMRRSSISSGVGGGV